MVRLDGYSQPKEIGSLIVNGQGGDMAYSTQNTSCDSEDPKRYRIKDVRFPSCTLVAFLMLGLLFQTVQATDCTYRKDSLGNTRYQCDDGRSGTLRKDSLGNVRDSQSGTTYRKDSLGNVRSSEGTTYRKDSLGNVRVSNPGTGDTVTWRKDSLGNRRASDGSVCHTDSLGRLCCDGNSTPPTVLQAK